MKQVQHCMSNVSSAQPSGKGWTGGIVLPQCDMKSC